VWNSFYKDIEENPVLKWEACDNVSGLSGVSFIDPSFIRLINRTMKYKCELPDYHLVLLSQDMTFPNLKEILEVYSFVTQISKTKIKRNAKITLIPLDIPKELDGSNFSPRNINSGVCINFQEIYIWRKEEMTKVLCHELIHMLHLDYLEFQDEIRHIPRKLFTLARNVQTEPNEATTDTLALVIMSFINAKRLKRSPEEIFKLEVDWTIKQMFKIWRNLKEEITFTSDIISYFFLKGFLLFYLLKNPGTIDIFLHNTILTQQDPSIDTIRDILLDYKNLIEFEKYSATLQLDTTSTLRMSCFSI